MVNHRPAPHSADDRSAIDLNSGGDQMNELEAKISEMKERLKRAQRDRLGKIVVGRLYDDLVDDIEDLFAQNQVRRAELSEKLGLTLNELNTLEEEIYQFRKKTQPSDQEPARAPAEIVESIQFQAVAIRKDEERAQPEPALFQDQRLWVRIVSMSGLKIEVNSLEASLEILRTVLAVHHRDDGNRS